MPSIRRVPADKRRSRTGCLPCRQRRRKCDEAKPQCANCMARRVSCAYKWTFVAEGRGRKDDRRADRPDRQDDPDKPINDDETMVDHGDGGHGHNHHHSVDSPPTHRHGGCGGLASILLHFRYKLAGWMDSMAPRSTFATDLLAIAVVDNNKRQPQVLDALAGLVARHDRKLAGVVESWRGVRADGNGDREDDTFADNVIRCLNSLQSFFGATPSAWGSVISSFYMDAPYKDDGLLSLPQPLQTLVRMHIKIDIANALLTGTRQRLNIPITSTLIATTDCRATLTPQAFYDACLGHLASSLSLCFSTDSGSRYPPQQAWLILWTRGLAWLAHRPPTMAPILATGLSARDGNITDAMAAAFPTEIYTSVLALQASIVTHLALAVLRAHKPPLLRLDTRGPQASKSWHTQKIAAVAVSNQFQPQQWDPAVTAAVLWVARDMTHPLQQAALTNCLEAAAQDVNMDLAGAVAELRAHWEAFRTPGG